MIDKLTALLENFDLAAFIPEVETFLGKLELFARLAVMAGPLVMLGMGLWFFLAPPKEANHKAGYRTFFGMGSVEAWLFTQKLAGMLWSGLGLLLTVIMALICNGYRGMEAMDMMSSVTACVVWELVLVLLSTVAIEVLVFLSFDKDGKRRKK